MSDLDEKVKEQRKKDAVDYRTKKKNSNLFLFCGSIFEVVETILIIMVLFIVFSFLMFRVFNATGDIGQKIFSIMTIVIFVGGLVLGFIVYKKVLGWVIEKFNLEDKLSKEVLDHYKKRTKEELEAEQKAEYTK